MANETKKSNLSNQDLDAVTGGADAEPQDAIMSSVNPGDAPLTHSVGVSQTQTIGVNAAETVHLHKPKASFWSFGSFSLFKR
ncbi:MAG: hypothetical protein AAFR17_10050 [Pseudomonadota bacterium]